MQRLLLHIAHSLFTIIELLDRLFCWCIAAFLLLFVCVLFVYQYFGDFVNAVGFYLHNVDAVGLIR